MTILTKLLSKYFLFSVSLFLVSIIFSCQHKPVDVNETIEVYYNFEDLAPRFNNNSDTTYLINFWATSCPPCLKEMPHLKEFQEKHVGEKIKVLLVSLDKKEDLDTRVKSFIKKYNITPEVALLADINYTAWTDDIDPSWYGALPATLIKRSDKKVFRFGAYESLMQLEEDFNSLN